MISRFSKGAIMIKTILTFLVVSFCAWPLFAQPVDTDWVRRYNGPANSSDGAAAIAVDGRGNVYVTGFSAAGGTGDDYTTIKYYPDGDTAWLRRYNGSSSAQDRACAIAVDNLGYVYVTGVIRNPGTADDYGTIKYCPNGDTAWVRKYNGPGNGWDYARAIAVDGDGNVYVTGYDQGSSSLDDFATIKYHPNGDTAWVRRYNGPGNYYDNAYDLAVDGSGNVYVTGQSWGGVTSGDYATIKYYPNGNLAWVSTYDGPASGYDESKAIAVDDSGYVYVTGLSWGGTGADIATIKYNPDGDTVWVRRYDGPSSDYEDDWSEDIEVDDEGNVYVTGRVNYFIDKSAAGSGSSVDYCTIKYYPNGDTAWVRTYDGLASSYNVAYALSLDEYGNVYVTGESWGESGTASADYATVKYDSDGNEAWVMRYDGPAGSEDFSPAVAVDAIGYVYVTGASNGDGTYKDWATIKYVQGAIHHVSIMDYEFLPQVDTIAVGDNIRWTNYGPHAHTVTSDAKTSWNSGSIGPGESFIYRFNNPGFYPYHCENYPSMTGTIVVEATSDVRDETGSRERPSAFTLSQNHPNPFNPTTEIEFTLAKSSFVTLLIYDILGRSVTTLISEQLTPGYKSVVWDGRDEQGNQVASGIYFYRVTADDYSLTRKMVLVK
jgi:plastocyanin